MEVVLMVFLRKSYSICLENSDLAKFWPLKTKIWPVFGQDWLLWEFFTYNFQTQLWILLSFGIKVVLMVFFEKIIVYMPGNSEMAKIWPFVTKIRPCFGQNWHFWEFLPVTFKRRYESSYFFIWKLLLWSFWENHTLYAGKFLIWQNFGHLRRKFGQFLAKIDCFESFYL